jgi:hypothetical protein
MSRLIREIAEGRSMKYQPAEVPLETRWLLYAGTWVAAYLGVTIILPLLAGTTPTPKDLLIYAVFSWLLPTGLIAWFDPGLSLRWMVPLIWLAYLVHGALTLSSRTTVRFYSLLVILAVVLVFNVVGCHQHPVPTPFL